MLVTAFVEISILFRGHQRHWSLSLANNSANLTPKLSPTFHVHFDKGTLALEDVKYCLAEWNHRKCGKERIEF